MTLALVLFAIDAVLACVLRKMWRSGWATNDARYRGK